MIRAKRTALSASCLRRACYTIYLFRVRQGHWDRVVRTAFNDLADENLAETSHNLSHGCANLLPETLLYDLSKDICTT